MDSLRGQGPLALALFPDVHAVDSPIVVPSPAGWEKVVSDPN